MLVMFPYTATAAQRDCSTRPYVVKCSAVTLVGAAVMVGAYALFGKELLSLMPHGSEYAAYVPYMPWLVIMTALTTCQVFYTNAEVSAGRYSFLLWIVPLHVIYPAALWLAASNGFVASLDSLLLWFGVASALRFLFSAIGLFR